MTADKLKEPQIQDGRNNNTLDCNILAKDLLSVQYTHVHNKIFLF